MRPPSPPRPPRLLAVLTLLVLWAGGLGFPCALLAATFSVRADGAVLRDGRPLLPLGFYGPEWSVDVAERVSTLDAIREAGFNVMLTEDANDFAGLLRHAEETGMLLIVGRPHAPQIIDTARTHRGSPAILGWTLADDADDGRVTVDELRALHTRLKTIAPDQLTWLPPTGFNAERRARADVFSGLADLSGLQVYPIGAHRYYDVEPARALRENILRTRAHVLAARANGRSALGLTQTFSWGEASDAPRYPTPEEARNLWYGMIVAGAKGVVAYECSRPLHENQPALWAELGRIARELLALAPHLLDGRMHQLETGDPDLFATRWDLAADSRLIVLNTAYAADLSLDLAGADLARAEPVFKNLPATLALAQGRLRGVVPARQVQVYRLVPAP